MFSTGIGLIMKGHEDITQRLLPVESLGSGMRQQSSQKPHWWSSWFDKGKKFLEEDVENDF